MNSVTRKIFTAMNLKVISALFALIFTSDGKRFSNCELAKVLAKNRISHSQISNWVCLAKHESGLNTAALSPKNRDGSRDHGIFQINDRYWCSPPGPHNDCKISCSALRNDNISDDIKCAEKIYGRHNFSAWYAWGSHCKGKDLSGYTKGCKY